jgi:hypothetical protein
LGLGSHFFSMAPNNKSPNNKLAKRNAGFGVVEVESLLDTMQAILPVSGMEWDRVELNHEQLFPDKKRSKDSLKRKFQKLYRHRLPTGDPNCPPDVRRAKRIHEEIKAKVDLSDGEDEEGDDVLDIVDDGDDDESSLGPIEDLSVAHATQPARMVVTTTNSTNSFSSASGTPRNKDDRLHRIVHKRQKTSPPAEQPSFSTTEYFKLMLMEREQDRKEERQRRDDERRDEERRRKEDNEREDRRHQQLMMQQMLMMQMLNRPTVVSSPPTSNHAFSDPLPTSQNRETTRLFQNLLASMTSTVGGEKEGVQEPEKEKEVDSSNNNP